MADEVAEDVVLNLDEYGHELLDDVPDKLLVRGLVDHTLDHSAAALVVAEIFKILNDFGLRVFILTTERWEQICWLELGRSF